MPVIPYGDWIICRPHNLLLLPWLTSISVSMSPLAPWQPKDYGFTSRLV